LKNLIILGSTGSIGTSALAVADRFPDRLRVAGLAAGSDSELLRAQVERYGPVSVALGNGEPGAALLRLCDSVGSRLLAGPQAVAELAAWPDGDVVVTAVVGAAGLEPTLAAVDAGKRVALANKEALVMAGELVLERARRGGAEIVPIDGEHNAIFQCLQGQAPDRLRRIMLCSSGGPLLSLDEAELDGVTIEQALNHPRWDMGRKISVDSATMMNKGLEMIEARWLFDLEPEQISVVIHPQSVVHSLVEFVDGSVLAQIGRTDMAMPIQYCLSYPERWDRSDMRLDLAAVSPLEFFEPDAERFPALALAREAMAAGGTAPAVLSAADEVAVEAFLEKAIPFRAVVEVVAAVLGQHKTAGRANLQEILRADRWAREAAREEVRRLRAG